MSLLDNPEEIKGKVNELRNQITTKALHLVNVVMPAKVLQLNEMYNRSNLQLSLKSVHQPIETDANADTKIKKRKLEEESESGSNNDNNNNINNADVPCNKAILDVTVELKREILELIEIITCTKIWIQLNIPKIEDGHNSGVMIQEETVAELGRSEDSGYAILDNISKYFSSRAKLVTKVLKNPHVLDYRQAVKELDEEEYVTLQLCLLDLRNNYAIMYDMITKNLDKIKTPRRTDHLASIF
eukprot:TRINITY_DN707_c0_g1_i1.p1 TRINITY_DN707_c0_g1~~TRINITY_DN707_c0_g1_i1.p1  ORF type:complete len:243 (+),score=37.39 TRINITY_DN707_c0_g1_i1:191-919(+)